MISTDLASELTAVVGEEHVLTDDELRAAYETDWTGRFSGRAAAVVRPGSTDEVANVMQACASHGAAVVAQGGNTGLVGGATPRGGEVILSVTRLDGVGEVDAATMQVDTGAGATLADLQAAAADRGLDAGLDFGARDTATIGGIVACDAGGTNAVRYGTASDRIIGLEAVLADGSVVRRMSGLLKDNAGYDLPSLMAGSEGTLAIITAVRWRLAPAAGSRVAALVGLDSLAEAGSLVGQVRGRLETLEACDFLTDRSLELVCDHLDVRPPLSGDHGAYLLIEVAGGDDPLAAIADALEGVAGEKVAIAESSTERERLWRLREELTEAIAAAGLPHKLDLGVPLDRLAELAEGVDGIVAAASGSASAFLFGHLGDGNVHVNVVGLGADDDRVDEEVLDLAAGLGGTISAEHGVGTAKARYLELGRSPEEIRAMREIKRALDPEGLLNPGAVLVAEET